LSTYLSCCLVALHGDVACCMFLENEEYRFPSVMLENKGNTYLIYFIIWDHGKSINQSYDNNAFIRWPFVNYPVLMNIHYYSVSTTWPRIHIIACCVQKTISNFVIDFNWLLIKKNQPPSPQPPSLTRKGYKWVDSTCTYNIVLLFQYCCC
jgi:hypothetical protein